MAVFALLAVLNVVLYWVFIPYRSQQRFMLQALGLAVVPLALRSTAGVGCAFAAAILLVFICSRPECWPFLAVDGPIPWDLSPDVPNSIGAPIPLFTRLETSSVRIETITHS